MYPKLTEESDGDLILSFSENANVKGTKREITKMVVCFSKESQTDKERSKWENLIMENT
jgi:hypothetical protein